jgi:hypothetical protein
MLGKEYLHEEDLIERIPEIKKNFGKNKKIPKDLELPFYTALSVYPELKNTPIQIKENSFGLTLQAQPDPDFLFKKKKNRSYRLNVNNDEKLAHGVLFRELPINAKIGIMAHELAHIYDYESKTNLQMAGFAIMFLCIKARKGIERSTDQEVIKRGFGWQLYDWSDFAMYRSSSPRRHKFYKHGYYLNPEEIMQEIETYPSLYNINQ